MKVINHPGESDKSVFSLENKVKSDFFTHEMFICKKCGDGKFKIDIAVFRNNQNQRLLDLTCLNCSAFYCVHIGDNEIESGDIIPEER